MLTGTSWGAATSLLLHIYRALIRSVLECGMEAYFFSSASSLEKLNKIQYAALRLCTRAMKSTPSICLLHSCDELQLHLKHQLLCLTYKAHLLTFPHHPTLPLISDSLQEVHPDSPTFQSFNLFTKHAVPLDLLSVHVLDAPHIPPWLFHKAHFDLSMTRPPYLQNPHVAVPTVLSHLQDHYSDLLHIYTHGSKTTHRTGSGIYIPECNIKKTVEINRHSSVLTSKLYAILSALYWLTRSNFRGAIILSDSLGAITSIRHATWNKHGLVNKVVCLNHVFLQRGSRLVYFWIPAHRGILSNDTADTLARLSTVNGPSPTDVDFKRALTKLSMSESSSTFSEHCWQLWNNQYTAPNKATHYKLLFPHVTRTLQ